MRWQGPPKKSRRGWARIGFSLGVILGLGLVAALAPLLAPHDPYEWSTKQSSLPPAWVQDVPPKGSAIYPLGTDRYGRDILSRMIYGTRTAFCLALVAVSLATLVGTLLGLVAGYSGGRLDRLILFLGDVIQSLPGILFVVIVILVLRGLWAPSWIHGLLALALGFAAVSWVPLARLVRVQALQLKEKPFIEAAVALGASPAFILGRHLLPNVLQMILAWVVNNIPAVILLEALLGYIGVGLTSAVDGGEFSSVSWGGIFFSGRSAMSRNPLMLVLPSLGILLFSASFILLADFLHEGSHPQQEE